MLARIAATVLLPVLLFAAPAKKTIGTARGENEDLILSATIHIDPADVKEMIGDDLGGHYIVAEIKVEPKYGKTVAIDRDDFVLRTDKDGEKAKPFVGNQITGREALIVRQTSAEGHKTGISLGGIMGGVGASPGGDNGETTATMQSAAKVKANPIQKVLDEKILPEKKTDQPVSGLLYFPMEKQKLKDLEMYYGDKDTRISLRFKLR
jgi:hypothetical protein